MVQFDNQTRQIKLKVVFYGPALGGKTTSLENIHRTIDPSRRTQLYSLNTTNDRTLFFDLFSLDLGVIRGYNLMLQLFTVPGQVQYNATRRAVLSGVDAVVFVADAQKNQMRANLESRRNLDDNLAANMIDPNSIPLVFQFNKQDLSPLTPSAELDQELNPDGAPVFLTTATSGHGVMDAFAAVTDAAVTAVGGRLGVDGNEKTLDKLRKQVARAFVPFIDPDDRSQTEFKRDSVVEVRTFPESDRPLEQSDLVEEAVRANLAMTDLNARLDTTKRKLEHQVDALGSTARFGLMLSTLTRPKDILDRLLEEAARHLKAQGGALMLFSAGSLREFRVKFLIHDPLLSENGGSDMTIADEIVRKKEPHLIVVDPVKDERSRVEFVVEAADCISALAIPLVAQDQLLGLLTLYRDIDRLPFDQGDLQLATTMVLNASVAYANAANWLKLQKTNQSLEDQVAERTQVLEATLGRVQSLNTELGEKHAALEKAYNELEELGRLKNELLARVSHELRTPVSSLLTAAVILSGDEPPPPEMAIRFTAIIRSEAEKLSEIIESVVQAAVLAAGENQSTAADTDVTELISAALEPLRDRARERDVEIHLQIHPEVSTICCDEASLTTAVRAVAKNAILFNADGGSVDIDVARNQSEEESLAITIRDSGTGIPTDDVGRAPDAFWQGGDIMTGKPPGIGLGLTIAKKVAEKHGGSLSISSNAGAGTTVVLSVPG